MALPEMLEREKQMAEDRNAPLGLATAGERGDEDRFAIACRRSSAARCTRIKLTSSVIGHRH